MPTQPPRATPSTVPARRPQGKVLLLASRIVTLDPAVPTATAIAVENGRIVACATREAFDTWTDASTRIVALDGAVAYPGFVESHGHLMGIGRQAERLYVGSPPCRTVRDILDRVAAEARRLPAGTWIVGAHYDDTLLQEQRPPTADELSAVAPHHPVYLSHMSGHLAVANRLALAWAGVDESTDVVGVMRDANGHLTGELREDDAMGLVTRLLPKPTREDRVRWLATGSRAALDRGVTAMSDAAFGEDTEEATRTAWLAYRDAVEQGTLGVRTQIFPTLRAREHLPRAWDDGWVSIGPVKLFADGSIQGHTGALAAPYHDAPAECGRLFWELADLVEVLRTLHAEHRQVATHANGDAAIQQVLDAYEQALGPDIASDHRWRVEHAQTARRDQIRRMHQLGVSPSFLLNHVEVFGDRHRDLFLGPTRAPNISPAAWALSEGVKFSLHSDVPVTPVDPLRSIATAVTRRTSSGAILGPHQAVTADIALRAYTAWAADLGRREAHVGRLIPGAWADLVVLSDDVAAVASHLPDITAVVVGGEQVR